jgi:hypothetical protein
LAFHILSRIYGKRLSSRRTEAEVSRHSEPETRLCERKDAEKGGIRSTEHNEGYRKVETEGVAPQGTDEPKTGLDLAARQVGPEQQAE